MCRSKAEGGRRCPGRVGRVSSVAVDNTGGSASPGPSGRMRRSREAVLRAAQNQLGDYLNAVVDAGPVDSAATLVSAAEADAAGEVADAITARSRVTAVRAAAGKVTCCAALWPRWHRR